MNKGGSKKRGATQGGSGEVTGHEERRIAPGKVTRTSKLEPSSQAEARVTSLQQPPAPVQQRRAVAVEPARAERAAMTERWLDTAMRPDIHPPPVQRKRSGAADALIHEDPGLEQEADVMGARAARGQRGADGAAASAGTDRAGQAIVPSSTSSSPAIQAKSADEKPLWENAAQDAAALLEAFQGLGTTEQVVYRVLNQPPEVVKAVLGIYDNRYNRHTGRGLVEDLRDEFDEMGGQADWQFVVGQLARAGIPVPGAEARYERQDPMAAEQRHARIVATPNVRVAVPGTRITYALVRGAELHAPGSRYTYQWYVINDPETSQKLGYPARVEGSDEPRVEAEARFVGNHKVICKEIYDPASGPPRPPVLYEFPQTVVPEGTLAQDALKQAPVAVDPARQLEVLETFLQVLREAEKQPGSSPLDPKTAAAYEKQIAALRKRLASTEGAERIPIQAVHVDREKARVSPLRAFVARTEAADGKETWRLVDITNPESRRLSGEYEGRGKDARAAIFAALAAWDEGNRYPTGRIRLEVGAEAAGEAITHELQTDGMSFWDSISEFFAEVGFWTGMGALAVGVVTAVAPVPGSRAVSALVWASILASSTSAAINITQRHAENMSSAREDAMDVLTIAGNVLAGAWMRGARVLVNAKGGTKIGTGLLIGQFSTDGAQGILLGVEYLEQYDRVMAIEDPKQRTDALMELLRSAALAGGMLFISIQGTRSDLGRLGKPGIQGDPTRLGNQGEIIDLDAPTSGKQGQDSISEAEQSSQPREAPHKEDTTETLELASLQENLEATGITPADAEAAIGLLRGADISATAAGELSNAHLQRLVRLGRIDSKIGIAWLKKHGIAGLDAVDRIEMAAAKELHAKLRDKGIDDGFAAELMGRNEPDVLERLVASDKVLNDLAQSPRRDAIVGEVDAMLTMQGYDVPYNLPRSTPEGSGPANRGHGYERHGAHTSDADQFARSKTEGHTVSRWDSFTGMQAHIDAAMAKVHNPMTPQGDASPINARGWKQIKAAKATVSAILADPLANMQHLKKKIELRQVDTGTRIGTEFDPDGVTARPVNHYTVVLQLDDTGKYRLLTSFPDRP